jgi:hypothetical protein
VQALCTFLAQREHAKPSKFVAVCSLEWNFT